MSKEATFYVVFDAEIWNPSYAQPAVRQVKARRISQKPPSLGGGEIALKFKVAIPDQAFLRLIPDVEVKIPDGWWTSQPVEVVPQEPPEEGA